MIALSGQRQKLENYILMEHQQPQTVMQYSKVSRIVTI
jgi:hypothetical protein